LGEGRKEKRGREQAGKDDGRGRSDPHAKLLATACMVVGKTV